MTPSTTNRRAPRLAAPVLACLLIGACERDEPTARAPAPVASKPAAAASTPRVQPKDVLETSATHVIGISYPPALGRYPELAAQAERYAMQARGQLLDAVRDKPADPALGPYELSLEFKLRHESGRMVVLAVDGSAYTGGAHGTPLIQRWVWLPPEDRVLTAAMLFPRAESWQRIAGEVREQLHAEVAQRMDADDVDPQQRAALVKSANAMIAGGTEPTADDFAVFEPVFDGDGRITALRFLFPPYQVGSYADGMHTVELPAARLVQDVAPAYRALFSATT